jgi:hypothetical protein
MLNHTLKLGYLFLLRLDNDEEFFLLGLQLLLKRRNLLVFSFGSLVQLLLKRRNLLL